ncbi:hypothetical protein PPERSA_06607 [Pseudocohnilembus persalinus]|uniref:Transmembrane protein n=1 Tax=Pseudocohnilembus persalinus TaxID=266149 RepID=A0A0V0QS21_PSEPJ|nr:hypothetical protein PPERSA_06607 [Pseudocohnilembus persalinus]|eukprot:KRX04973.1 hypothetical protein PPERSA_06607 [Pseudocohnilembus persalinus]
MLTYSDDSSTTPTKKQKKVKKVKKQKTKKKKEDKPNKTEKSPLQMFFELVAFTQMVVLWVLIGVLKKKGNINYPWVYPSVNVGIWAFFTIFSIFPRFGCYFVKLTKNNALKQYYIFTNFTLFLRIHVGIFMYFLFIIDIVNIHYDDGMIFVVVLVGFCLIFPIFPYYIYYSLHYKNVENHYYDEEDYYELAILQKQQKKDKRNRKPIPEDQLYESHIIDDHYDENKYITNNQFQYNKNPNFATQQYQYQMNQNFMTQQYQQQLRQQQHLQKSQQQNQYAYQPPFQNNNSIIGSQIRPQSQLNFDYEQQILPISHQTSSNQTQKLANLGFPNPFMVSKAQTTGKKNKNNPLQQKQLFKENMRNFSNSIDLTNENQDNYPKQQQELGLNQQYMYNTYNGQQKNQVYQNQMNGHQNFDINPPQKKSKKKKK